MASGVILQGAPVTVVTPTPHPLPIALERLEEEYPDTDGKPMAENTWQATTMHYAGEALAIHFRGREFVATDLPVHYRKGDKGATVAPDVMVVLGADGSDRRSYRLWEEGGRAPDFVLGGSRARRRRGMRATSTTYARLVGGSTSATRR